MTHTRARLLWTFGAMAVILVGTAIAIRLAQGYRPSRDTLVAGKGLLVANSTPKGARLFINDRFTSATDDTIYLDKGEYDVTIEQEGYFTWRKKVRIDDEVVTQVNALLFPSAPSLSPLTFSGAHWATPSPDGQKLAFAVASASAQTKNGYYVVELADNPLALQRGPRQITTASSVFPPDTTDVVWSPDSSQVLLMGPNKTVLLDPGRTNDVETMADVSLRLPEILSEWEEEMYRRDRQRLAKFPALIQEIATSSAVNAYFSPDEEALLYTASAAFTLPDELIPAKPGSNTQAQTRTTKPGEVYIYDGNEDRQFRIGTDPTFGQKNAPAPKKLLSNDLYRTTPLTLEASPSAFLQLQQGNPRANIASFKRYHSPLYTHGFQWFPTSRHFLTKGEGSITITDYDATNAVTVYSGPFRSDFVYPWPDGSRIIILTSFNQGPTVPENLYTVDLK